MVKKILRILLLYILPFSVISYLILSLSAGESQFTLFPGGDIQTGSYSDAAQPGGKSIINSLNVNPERIMFSYTLKKGYTAPYAGFAVRTNGPMDLSSYDVLKIKMGSARSHSVLVILLAKIPGYTVDNDFSTYLLLQKEVVVRNGNLYYTLNLAEFFPPEWWWSARDLAEDDPRLAGVLGNVYSISLQSGAAEPVDAADTFLVEEIGFSKTRQPLLVLTISILSVYSLTLITFFLVRRYKYSLRNKANKVVTAYRSMDVDQSLDETSRKIIKYIGENYSNPGTWIETVSRDCGLPPTSVPQCLKKHFGLSFPQYLTAIRLAEAKRLLQETDLTIAEIAYAVGFSSIPHFNRVFKSGEGIAPHNFRAASLPGITRRPVKG